MLWILFIILLASNCFLLSLACECFFHFQIIFWFFLHPHSLISILLIVFKLTQNWINAAFTPSEHFHLPCQKDFTGSGNYIHYGYLEREMHYSIIIKIYSIRAEAMWGLGAIYPQESTNKMTPVSSLSKRS